MAVNIIAKGVPGKEYLIRDMMATRLNETQFSALQAINPDTLGGYRFIPQAETDFSWWDRISKKLTATRIKQAYFNCDFYGKVTEL